MTTGYYLLDNPNPHRSVREDGRRFNGRASRRSQLRLIGVHTAENSLDLSPPDTGAEGVAGYLSRTERFASYHLISDSDSAVPLLPTTYTAYGIRSLNSPTWHLSFALKTHQWDDDTAWAERTLRNAIPHVAAVVRDYNIPLRWLTRDEAFGGASGFVRHSVADPGRRSDPGRLFPVGRFIELLRRELAGPRTAPEPTPKPDGRRDVMGVIQSGPSREHFFADVFAGAGPNPDREIFVAVKNQDPDETADIQVVIEPDGADDIVLPRPEDDPQDFRVVGWQQATANQQNRWARSITEWVGVGRGASITVFTTTETVAAVREEFTG